VSTLYLIRHGQASFGAANYDVLSERGVEQSRHLGMHWATKEWHLDAIYTGPRERQRDTATHFIEAARTTGREYPEMVVLDEFDEYPAFELLRHWIPILSNEDPELAELAQGGVALTRERLNKAFNIIIGKWTRGELDEDGLESYRQFVERVERGLQRLMEQEGRGRRVAVTTSGGPISVAMRHALGLADETTMRVAAVVANSSVSEFRYRDDRRLTMVAFNRIPHLPEALITYR
jgi:broad specificity phosphatase PhoE